MARRWALGWLGLLALGVSGCSGPIGLYHDAEGGAIAENRQPPPGADLPYPNLASVPAAPVALSSAQQAAVQANISGAAPDVSPASPAALAGLELPDAAPPAPDLPGLTVPHSVPEAAAAIAPAAPEAPAPPARPAMAAPVSLSFAPASALLNPTDATALSGIAAARGNAGVLVGGFGEAADMPDDTALRLALARAQRLANELTADGVPASAITMTAAAAGSGGFVQLVY